MAKCSFIDCNVDIFEDNKCILHCEKDDLYTRNKKIHGENKYDLYI